MKTGVITEVYRRKENLLKRAVLFDNTYMDSNLKNQFSLYYKNAKEINDFLMEKSNYVCCEEIDIQEALLFHMSSLMLSLLINFFDGRDDSISNFLCARSLIEDVSVILYCYEDIEDEKEREKFIKLFQCSHFIFDYRIYSKFPSFMNQTCNVSEMTENYEKALDIFSTEFGVPTEEVENRYFDKPFPPFFGRPNFTFSKLVKKVFKGQQDKTYKALSLLSHPHTIGSREIFDSHFLIDIIGFFGQNYFSFNKSPSGKDYFTEKLVLVDLNTLLSPLNDVYKKQEKILMEVIQFFDKEMGSNVVSQNLQTALTFIEEFKINRFLGFDELGKIKMRLVLETLASFSFIYFDTSKHGKFRYGPLFTFYSNYLFLCSLVESENLTKQIDEVVDQAYLHYKKIFDSSISKSDFSSKFKAPLGWSIDENGKTESLTKLVKTYINFTFPSVQDGVTNYRDLACVYYEESEIMTHANGYLYSSNSGAFFDIDNCIILLDVMVGSLLEMIYLCFRVWAVADEQNKLFRDFLFKIQKEYKCVMEKKKTAVANLPQKIQKPSGF